MTGRRLGSRWRRRPEELTIDELARRTGMTVRNIRAHQSRGLLPAPQVRGRTGFYGPEHESRINLIRELQADGYKLEAIGRLLDSAGGSSEEVLRFTRAVKAPFEDEEPQIVSAEELAERWNAGEAAPELLRKAEKLGILRPLPDGNFEELSPSLGRASAELAGSGSPPRPRSTSPARSTSTRARWRRSSSSCSSSRSGSRSRSRAARRRICRRFATRSSACARSPPTPCWRCSSW